MSERPVKPYVNWDKLLKKLAWMPVDQSSRSFTDREAKNEVIGFEQAEKILALIDDALEVE